MTNLVSRAIAGVSALLNGLQVKRFLAVFLVGFLLLTSNVAFGNDNKNLGERAYEKAHQTDSVRPKTTREWYQEGRETNNAPGERLQRIAEESGQAFKEFGSGYVEGAKQTGNQVKEGAAKAGQDLSNQVQR